MVRAALLVIAICAVATSPLNAQRGGSGRSNTVGPAPDCGAKCLYVILRANSLAPITYQALVQELGPAPKKGYSFLQLRDSARRHGLYAECLKLSKEALISTKGKASVILHMTPNHFVVCEAISGGDVTIFDSGGGFVRNVSHDYLGDWSGNALFISPSPIELPSKGSQVWVSGSIAGLVFLFLLVALWVWRGGQSKQALLTIVIFASLSMLGCGVAEPSAKAVKPQLVIDSPKRELGNLERKGRLHEVSVSLRNVGNNDIEITKVLTSCSCMQGRLVATKIAPRSSVALDLLLDCSSVGSKAASAIIECNGIPTAQLSVDWTVVTSLSAEPGSINGVELASGQSTDVELQLVGRNEVEWPLLQAKCCVNSELGLTAAARIAGTKCIVSFQASKEIEAGTAKGSVEISVPGNEKVSVSVPFCVILNESLSVSPSKLFLTSASDGLSAQLLMSTEMPEFLNGLELTWLGESRFPCTFEKVFRDGVCILSLRADEVAAKGVTHLEIATAGGFLKRLPVFLPASPK